MTHSTASGDLADVFVHVVGHGIDDIVAFQIFGAEAASPLRGNIDLVLQAYFLGKTVRRFTGMVTVGTGGVYLPVQAILPGFMPEYTFGYRGTADIAQAYY